MTSVTIESVQSLYVDRKMTLVEVADELDCCSETVSKKLKEAGIQVRLGPRYQLGNLKVPSDELLWAYLAGLVDGEGSICLITRTVDSYQVPSVSVCNTDVKVMRWLVHNFGGSYYARESVSPTGRPAKQVYYWAVRRVGAVLVLCDRMLPYLVVKVEKARTVLDVCKVRVKL